MVKAIGDKAFSGYFNLASIMLPDGVTSIGNQAFEKVTELIVSRDSFAANWAKENGFSYENPDSNDWSKS